MDYGEEKEIRNRMLEIISSYGLQTINDVIMLYQDLYGQVYAADTIREILGVNELWQLIS